jgi:hypothetical protein
MYYAKAAHLMSWGERPLCLWPAGGFAVSVIGDFYVARDKAETQERANADIKQNQNRMKQKAARRWAESNA